MTLQIDRFTKSVLMIIAVMTTLIAMALWMAPPPVTEPAYARPAGIPDSGQQLQSIDDSVKQIQQSLNQLNTLLVSGRVKVQVVEAKDVARPRATESETPANPPVEQ